MLAAHGFTSAPASGTAAEQGDADVPGAHTPGAHAGDNRPHRTDHTNRPDPTRDTHQANKAAANHVHTTDSWMVGMRQIDKFLEQPPPLQRHVDRVTAVAKGPEYERAQAELRDFYRQMEIEAQQVTSISGTIVDGPYGCSYGHDAQEFSHGLVNVRYRIHLDGNANGVPAPDLKRLRDSITRGVDEHYNFQHTITGASGESRRLHMEVEFVANPSDAHLSVTVHPGNGRANLENWFADGHPTTHAHEIGHGAFGWLDEYVDFRVLNRATTSSPGVHHDNSLMGNYWRSDSTGSSTPDPDTGLRQRHLDEISADMVRHSPASPPVPHGSAAPSPHSTRSH